MASELAQDAVETRKQVGGRMAVGEDWSQKVVGGCDRIWTDFGTPMCGVGGSACFVINPEVQSCPLGKRVREGSRGE